MSSGPEAVTAATEAASPARSSVVIDTHVLIWYTTAPNMLSATAHQMLEYIVATAQAWSLPLLTKDSALTRHFPELCVW